MRAQHALPRNSCILFIVVGTAAGVALAQTPLSTPETIQSFSRVTGITQLANGIELRDGALILRITALRDDVLRIRAGTGALPEDASWAALPEARAASIAVTQDGDATVLDSIRRVCALQ